MTTNNDPSLSDKAKAAEMRAFVNLINEDMERTMEERVSYTGLAGEWITIPPNWDNVIHAATAGGQVVAEQQHTFLVILPGNDRRHIQAAYMEANGGSLYFEDDNRETILAFGPGHWVWAERVEDGGQK